MGLCHSGGGFFYKHVAPTALFKKILLPLNKPRRGGIWKKDKSIYRDPFEKIFFVIRDIIFL
jgi:hypothetical protein